jgi:TolA-binding protein
MKAKGRATLFILILIVLLAAGFYQFREREWFKDFLRSARIGIEGFKEKKTVSEEEKRVTKKEWFKDFLGRTGAGIEGFKDSWAQRKGADEEKVLSGGGVTVIPEIEKVIPEEVKKEKKTTKSLDKYSQFLFSKGEYELAIREYSKIIRDYPRHSKAPEVQYTIGESYRQLRNFEEAIKAYRKVIRTYPAGNYVARSQYNVAVIYHLDLEDYEQARKEYKKVFLIKGALADDAQFMLGSTYYQEGSLEEAKEEYQRVIDKYPQSKRAAAAQYKIGKCYEGEEDWEKAIEVYRMVVEKYPGKYADKSLKAIYALE